MVQEQGVCWAILAVLGALLAATLRNGYIFSLVGRNLAKEIAAEMERLEALNSLAKKGVDLLASAQAGAAQGGALGAQGAIDATRSHLS